MGEVTLIYGMKFTKMNLPGIDNARLEIPEDLGKVYKHLHMNKLITPIYKYGVYIINDVKIPYHVLGPIIDSKYKSVVTLIQENLPLPAHFKNKELLIERIISECDRLEISIEELITDETEFQYEELEAIEGYSKPRQLFKLLYGNSCESFNEEILTDALNTILTHTDTLPNLEDIITASVEKVFNISDAKPKVVKYLNEYIHPSSLQFEILKEGFEDAILEHARREIATTIAPLPEPIEVVNQDVKTSITKIDSGIRERKLHVREVVLSRLESPFEIYLAKLLRTNLIATYFTTLDFPDIEHLDMSQKLSTTVEYLEKYIPFKNDLAFVMYPVKLIKSVNKQMVENNNMSSDAFLKYLANAQTEIYKELPNGSDNAYLFESVFEDIPNYQLAIELLSVIVESQTSIPKSIKSKLTLTAEHVKDTSRILHTALPHEVAGYIDNPLTLVPVLMKHITTKDLLQEEALADFIDYLLTRR